jgi:hypothetical protein
VEGRAVQRVETSERARPDLPLDEVDAILAWLKAGGSAG